MCVSALENAIILSNIHIEFQDEILQTSLIAYYDLLMVTRDTIIVFPND